MSIEKDELRIQIAKALKHLSYREREVIKLRYGIADGYAYTAEEVAHIFKSTRERMRQIEAKAIEKLQGKMSALQSLAAAWNALPEKEPSQRSIVPTAPLDPKAEERKDYFGKEEVAAVLGVSVACLRVYLAKRKSGEQGKQGSDFPLPVKKIGLEYVWDKREVFKYQVTFQKQEPGKYSRKGKNDNT